MKPSQIRPGAVYEGEAGIRRLTFAVADGEVTYLCEGCIDAGAHDWSFGHWMTLAEFAQLAKRRVDRRR